MNKTSPGIKPTDTVLLIERNGAAPNRSHNAIVLAMSMNPIMSGTKGEPSIEAIFVRDFDLPNAGLADWRNAVSRVHDVVHSSHPDWLNGRASLCYEEVTASDLINLDSQGLPASHIEMAARTAHEANRILCLAMGDHSQLPWTLSPEWQRDSALAGAHHILIDPATTPEQSHASWMEQKLAEGWKYGKTKDAEYKTHPCIVPYAELPVTQQIKDFMFGAVTRGVYGLQQLNITSLPPDIRLPIQHQQSNEGQASNTNAAQASNTNQTPQPEEVKAEEPVPAVS